MTRTTHRLTAGPYSVRCIGPHCAYWLQDFDRSGLHGRVRYYSKIKAARIAARLEARRMGRLDARIDADIVDADGRIVDAFHYSGPWESAGPFDRFESDKPARVCLIYPGNEPRFLPGAYRTLRGAQAAARRAFRAAVESADSAHGAPESVQVIDTSRNDW